MLRRHWSKLLAEGVDLIQKIRLNLPAQVRLIPGVWHSLDRLEAICHELSRLGQTSNKPDTEEETTPTTNGSGGHRGDDEG